MSQIIPFKKRSAKTFSDMHSKEKLPLEKILNCSMRGDCLEWLDRIPDNSLDMIYIDPPFFTRTDYEVIWGNGWEKAAWEDWKKSTKGDIDGFIEYMSYRIHKMKDKLKDSGTFWLHCDHRANYKFRALLEGIFGGNFIAEIVVQTTEAGRDQATAVGKSHETIFVFSKNKSGYFFNNTYSTEKIPKSYKYRDHRGVYSSGDLTQDGAGPPRTFNGRSVAPPPGKHWIWKQARIDRALANEANRSSGIRNDFIIFTENGVPRVKRYWKGNKTSKLVSLWTDCIKNSWTEDNIKYGTKKSLSLMQRIIQAGCPEGGTVGDFFSGGGTTLLAAAKMGRNFIGCDVSPVAIKAQAKRFRAADLKEPLVLGYPKSKKTYLEMNDKKDKTAFERFLSEICGWVHLQDVSGQGNGFDAYIDGPEKIAVQIKNWSNSAGAKEVRNLAGALTQSQGKYKSALLVAWDLSMAGHEALSKIKKSGVKIEFVKIEYFLDCFLISEEKEKEIDDLLDDALKSKTQTETKEKKKAA